MKTRSLRGAHALSASVLSVFVFAHLANHLAALGGMAAHTAFLHAARLVYRQPWVEALLLASVAFQVASGLALVIRGRSRRHRPNAPPPRVPRIQAASGAYLAAFLLLHVSAVLAGRIVLKLDTDFRFAAAGFHVWPFPIFFIPYYFCAVLAFFTHLACAGWRHADPARPRLRLAFLSAPIALGLLVAVLIPLCLGGVLIPVEIPALYTAPYRSMAP